MMGPIGLSCRRSCKVVICYSRSDCSDCHDRRERPGRNDVMKSKGRRQIFSHLDSRKRRLQENRFEVMMYISCLVGVLIPRLLWISFHEISARTHLALFNSVPGRTLALISRRRKYLIANHLVTPQHQQMTCNARYPMQWYARKHHVQSW